MILKFIYSFLNDLKLYILPFTKTINLNLLNKSSFNELT